MSQDDKLQCLLKIARGISGHMAADISHIQKFRLSPPILLFLRHFLREIRISFGKPDDRVRADDCRLVKVFFPDAFRIIFVVDLPKPFLTLIDDLLHTVPDQPWVVRRKMAVSALKICTDIRRLQVIMCCQRFFRQTGSKHIRDRLSFPPVAYLLNDRFILLPENVAVRRPLIREIRISVNHFLFHPLHLILREERRPSRL